ncbi:MAG: cation:proton antiporter [Syntrophobacteria bacterium]
MEVPLLKDLIIIFALAVAVLSLCHRLRVPAIVGFMFTGLLAGPHGLGLIRAGEVVEVLAEIGVILLLFTVGIEFSLKTLTEIKRSVVLGGSLQVFLTLGATWIIWVKLGQPPADSLFFGFLISLSSTAIVLKLLQERAEIESPHGRTALAVLIFQDVAVVPMMLLVPLLADAAGLASGSALFLLAKAVGIVILVVAGARWVVPSLLYHIVRTRSRELFVLSVLVICFAVAWLTHLLGLSLALGAFMAGLIISESEYSQQTLANILPFRDVFTSLFFVSIGMLLDVSFIVRKPEFVLLAALTVVILKSLIACFSVLLLGLPLRTAVITGLALSQVGEFSFILSLTGITHGLLDETAGQLFLAVSVLTMGATPFIMNLAPRLADATLRLPVPRKVKAGLFAGSAKDIVQQKPMVKNHVIIAGFGLNGRNVAQAARSADIDYVIIEMNPETVRKESSAGEPIFYGDASQEAVLEYACVQDARVMVTAVSDPVATRRITATARRLNPKLHIITRTRFFQEMAPLYELGANEVIPEDFETSVEIFSRVLAKYLIPKNEIDRFTREARADGYQMFRSPYRESAPLCDIKLHFPDAEVTSFRVSRLSALVGKSLAEIDLRKRYGITILAIRRDSEILANPDAHTKIAGDDILIALGSPGKLAGVARLFSPEESGSCRESD